MHVRRSPAALLAAPSLALALLLSGCGGSSSVADPPVSSGPTSSAPTSDPPHRESPQHFIRRWAEAEKQMENTGKTGPYLALSVDCSACRAVSAVVEQYYSDGGFIRWDGWKIQSIKPYGAAGASKSFAVHSVSAPTTYRESASAPRKSLPGGPITYVLKLSPKAMSFVTMAKAQLDQ